jgi:exopolyphosphatase/guanosine-5'-triphosphate,3'-diphosphate pyrophosphatase
VRRIAVVDLGSNSFRLVVFRYEPGGAWSVWDEIRAPVRLSAGMGPDHLLRPKPVGRALETVRTFAAFCAQTGVDDVVATGTSALRRAANGPEVVAEIEAAGLPVRILDEREEAWYGALAILNSTTVSDGFGLDMGGGSIQLMHLAGRDLAESVSLPFGAVRATEEYDGVKALRKAVRRALSEVDWFACGEAGAPLAGIGGSVRNIAAAAQRLRELPNGGVQGFALTTEMLGEVIAELESRDVEERRALPGINPDRGDVILAAAVVLETILAEGGFEAIETTEAGLREGLFFERYLEHHEPPVFADVGAATIGNLIVRYGRDPAHAARVARWAEDLYDGLAGIEAIQADAEDRSLLEAAALLHDIGRAVGFDQRHKHARYLILNDGLPGFRREAMLDVAEIVRYVPKGTPDADTRVELLAGILRIAEQLERSRAGDVEGLAVREDDDEVVIAATIRPGASVGVWAAAHATELLADALGRSVHVEA